MPIVTDEEAALQAISSFDSPSTPQQSAKSQIDRLLHTDDGNPFVDVHELFPLYDVLYFCGRLSGNVEVSWSKRLTLCAGICELIKDDHGKYKPIRLKLSEALLKYRPREDIINTLLHEYTSLHPHAKATLLTEYPGSIHAYLFLTTSYHHSRSSPSDDGHGPGFLLLASSINAHAKTNITTHHGFHAEVDAYRTHIWQCSGNCRQKPPHFGLVKRAMNRPPGKSDSWFARHEEECGGVWTKIAEPEPKPSQPRAVKTSQAGKQKNNLDGWIKKEKKDSTPLTTTGPPAPTLHSPTSKRPHDLDPPATPHPAPDNKKLVVECPICNSPMTEDRVNEHLDVEHPP
ncbi:hypothetical protein FGG08_003554 [Glutinoglossum americanum]|uniref:Protein with SprT-like domain at the N terminus n=1 Tax=Glutinoglossum americanum TaxID=1670608 RepID=A0A9P8L3D8_9PEZI|nr:hypothetical protein FGG08_003554 [Glutinoglossum americanum]